MNSRVMVYSTTHCPYCLRAKALLQKRAIPYEEVDVTNDVPKREWLVQAAGGRKTVPQIFIDGRSIGGFQELAELDAKGDLAPLAATPPDATEPH
jgi:glutaredoxin 3